MLFHRYSGGNGTNAVMIAKDLNTAGGRSQLLVLSASANWMQSKALDIVTDSVTTTTTTTTVTAVEMNTMMVLSPSPPVVVTDPTGLFQTNLMHPQ